ncbi:hypothetical protein A0H81_09690 [Grifola frondosa]|uniref:Uncharacterized protein n=1 Tax=Grifola frondosa TaxID=5627 RepID=A0A1C7LZT1_GRIFR|nr:hypothetical protein A0H81_09690 [Grifola frondosa]
MLNVLHTTFRQSTTDHHEHRTAPSTSSESKLPPHSSQPVVQRTTRGYRRTHVLHVDCACPPCPSLSFKFEPSCVKLQNQNAAIMCTLLLAALSTSASSQPASGTLALSLAIR